MLWGKVIPRHERERSLRLKYRIGILEACRVQEVETTFGETGKSLVTHMFTAINHHQFQERLYATISPALGFQSGLPHQIF